MMCSLSSISGFGKASGVSLTVISGVTMSALRSEMFCYGVLCSSAPGIKCWTIIIGAGEHLDCGLPIMW